MEISGNFRDIQIYEYPKDREASGIRTFQLIEEHYFRGIASKRVIRAYEFFGIQRLFRIMLFSQILYDN